MKQRINKLVKCANLIKLLILLKYVKKKKKALRRWWVRPHLTMQERNRYGAYNTLFQHFALRDHEEFHRFAKMSFNQFINLHDLIKIHLLKTSRRPSLPPMLRLASVLCVLAHGSDVASTSWSFRISKEILYLMINEVCSVICNVLMPTYVQFPDEQRWLSIVNDYWNKWQFPNCLGALDGKHFRLDCPRKSGTLFFNYRKYYSFSMLATCDANYKITWFNLGDYGSCSDSSVFAYTDLYRKMVNDDLNIPASLPLPNTDVNLPLAFIADEIFPILTHLLKPYSRRLNLNYEKKIFNYRLKRARLTIECAFGILTSRFSILRKSLKFNLATSKNIVAATICLHNYIISTSLLTRIDNENANQLNNVHHLQQGRINPVDQRNLLSQYFTSPVGAIPWQDQYI